MIFSDLYKSPRSTLSKFRHPSFQLPTPLPTDGPEWLADEYADLLSKDKSKQKEAVKRYLAAKVKNNWEFSWPSRLPTEVIPNSIDERITPPTTTNISLEKVLQRTAADNGKQVQGETGEDDGYKVDDSELDEEDDDDDDAQSVYSVVSENPLHYRPRTEWTSDLSDEDEDGEAVASASPYRFDNTDSVGSCVKASILAKRAQRRRAIRMEMEWNEGLACFEARRNAWTGARTVRIRTKPVSPPTLSPRSPRRFFFRRSMSGSPPNSVLPRQQSPGRNSDNAYDASSLARSDGSDLRKQQTKDTTPSTNSMVKDYPVETLIPLAAPLLPPSNQLRASITPSVYLSLYEKVIISNLQPSCPINLSDMLRACVSGWKRDGEWPPRPTATEASVAARKKKKNKPIQDGSASGGAKDIARRMSFGLLGRDVNEDAGVKGIRRSLQRALGINGNGPHEATTGYKA